MRRTHTAILLLTVCFAACLSGCASYVNIPPQPGDTAIHKPDMIPVPELMTDALVWATARYPVEPPFAVNLPPDTPRVTYNNVVERGTRGRGVPMSADVEHLPTYHIAEVRIRGTRAQVDIILPRGQKASATTVTLRSTVSGWRMQDARSWIAGVVPVPFANYIPAYSSVYDDEETAEAIAEEPPLVEDDTPRAPLVRGVPRQAQPVAQPVAEPEESVRMELEEESSSSVVVTKKPAQPDAVPGRGGDSVHLASRWHHQPGWRLGRSAHRLRRHRQGERCAPGDRAGRGRLGSLDGRGGHRLLPYPRRQESHRRAPAHGDPREVIAPPATALRFVVCATPQRAATVRERSARESA